MNKSLNGTIKMFEEDLWSIQFIECKFQRLLFITIMFESDFLW